MPFDFLAIGNVPILEGLWLPAVGAIVAEAAVSADRVGEGIAAVQLAIVAPGVELVDAALAVLVEIVEVLFHVVDASNLLHATRLNTHNCLTTITHLQEARSLLLGASSLPGVQIALFVSVSRALHASEALGLLADHEGVLLGQFVAMLVELGHHLTFLNNGREVVLDCKGAELWIV